MSRERELLMKVCKFLDSDVENNYGLVSEIRSLLAQPNEEKLSMTQRLEEYKKGYARAEQHLKREHLSEGELNSLYYQATSQTLREQDTRLAFGFARAIEKAHGIGIDDENHDA
jgi:hypothetical protein